MDPRPISSPQSESKSTTSSKAACQYLGFCGGATRLNNKWKSLGIIMQFVGWKISEYVTKQMCVIWWSYISISPGGSPLMLAWQNKHCSITRHTHTMSKSTRKTVLSQWYRIPTISPHVEHQSKLLDPQLLNQGFYIVVFHISSMGFQPCKHRSRLHPL